MTKSMIHKIITLTLISLLAFSCSSNKKKEDPTAEQSYLEAHKALKRKNYSEAGDLFDKIDDDFPFSKWGPKAKTMAVYARYKNEEYDKLTQIVDDFTKLNPVSEHNPYLLYMKGRAYFNQIPHIKRAQDDTQVSSYVFRELIARYPDTKYAQDAQSKLSLIDEHIAGHIMEIGRNEIKNKNYIGALTHFTKITSRYRYTEQISEAYFRIFEIFTKLGINSEANKIEKILKSKYPDSLWTRYITGEVMVPETTQKDEIEAPQKATKNQETKIQQKPISITPKTTKQIKSYKFIPQDKTPLSKNSSKTKSDKVKIYKFPSRTEYND